MFGLKKQSWEQLGLCEVEEIVGCWVRNIGRSLWWEQAHMLSVAPGGGTWSEG